MSATSLAGIFTYFEDPVGIQIMDLKGASIVFDWVGSLLMLGTVWGWIYAKISPAIHRKLVRSLRALDALDRLVRRKCGELSPDGVYVGGIDERFRRVRDYRAKLGIKPEWPPLTRTLVEAANAIRIVAAIEKEKGSEEEYQELRQFQKAHKEMTGLLIRYSVSRYSYFGRLAVVYFIDVITTSLFSGRGGTVLFVVGFVLWNLSKGISLFSP